MGFIGDALVQGQQPRENGCICAYALLPIAGGVILSLYATFKAAEAAIHVLT